MITMQDPIYAKIESTQRPTPFAACGLVLLAAVGLWVSSLVEIALDGAGMALADALYYLPFVALPLLLYRRGRPWLPEAMRLNPPPVLPTVSVILLGLFSVYAASGLSALWGWGLDALGLRSIGSALPQTRREVMLGVVTMAAVPAVCEELLFRGVVLSAWESRGTWFAIGVTAALFALLHGNLYGLPAYLLVGLVAGFVTWALDSVYAGIVYHTVYNAACLILPWALSGGDGGEVEVTASLMLSIGLETVTVLSMMAMALALLRVRAHREGVEPIPRIRRPLEARDRWMLAACVAEMAVSIVLLTLLAMGGGI